MSKKDKPTKAEKAIQPAAAAKTEPVPGRKGFHRFASPEDKDQFDSAMRAYWAALDDDQ